MKTPMYDLLFMQAKNGSNSGRDNYRKIMNFTLSELNESRIFKIPSELTNLFIKSDAPPSYNLPFKTIFLETKFSAIAKLSIYNEPMHIKQHEVPFITESTEILGILLVDLNEDVFICGNVRTKDNLIAGFSGLLKEHKDLAKSSFGAYSTVVGLIFNFLCFVNSPDIEYITVTDSKRDTEIRRRKGKPQRPPIANNILTNPLKRYIYKQKHNEKMVYSHRFWVRGHWRTLRDKRYGENQGKKLWIKPYIKGDGLLINKKYELRT